MDADLDAGFDIYSAQSGGKTISNTAFAVLRPVDGVETFYTVDLLTGAATRIDEFPLSVSDVAVALNQY